MPCNSRDAYTWTVKMYKTFQNIDAKYAVVDSDDDFLDYNFVHSCMHIMDQNPFIAAVNGVVHDFSLISTQDYNPVEKRQEIKYSNDGLFCSMRYFNHASSFSSNTSERLMTSSVVWPYEAVHRASIFKVVLRICVRLGIDNYLGFLFIHRMITLASGGYMLDSSRISTFRQDNTPDNSGSQIQSRYSSKYHYYSEDQIFNSLDSPSNVVAIGNILYKARISIDLPISEIISRAMHVTYKTLTCEMLQKIEAPLRQYTIPLFENEFFNSINKIVEMKQR